MNRIARGLPNLAVAVALAALALLAAACGAQSGESSEPAAEASAPAAPSPGDAEYAQLTARWSRAALEGCGRTLREALGTRDLVAGALAGVKDPEGLAIPELHDANSWMEQGNAKLAEVRPQLESGACEPAVTLALDEAVQFYVKAGTSAVQAGQIAGS